MYFVKKKLIGLLMGLCLTMPGLAMANGEVPEAKCKGMNNTEDCNKKSDHTDKNWQQSMKQKQQILLSLVNKFTPEKKKEWESVINERNKLMTKWSSPEFAEKRTKWKQDKKAKIEDLKKQYEEGKISKEQFYKNIHNNKEMGQWKIYQELRNSVKSQDDQKTAQLLNQLLTHFKQKNEMLKSAMKG
jgi:hypothetical protein